VRFLPTRHFKDPRNKYIGGLQIAIKGYTSSKEEERKNKIIERPFAGTLTKKETGLTPTQFRQYA
jgi:hypothetical protein